MGHTLYQEKLFDGDVYTVARDFTLANSGDTMRVRLSNPAGSGKTIVVDTLVVNTDSSSSGTFYRNPDVSGGTDVTPQSDYIGGGTSTVANANFDGTFSNANQTTGFPLSSGGKGESSLAKRPPIAIGAGNSVGVQITADTSDVEGLAMFVFYETDRML